MGSPLLQVRGSIETVISRRTIPGIQTAGSEEVRFGRNLWLAVLAGVILSSCISNNLRQARQMMTEKRFDEACRWYDEAIAELVPTNSLTNERREAYQAAAKFHISTGWSRLQELALEKALSEAKKARKCEIVIPRLAPDVQALFDAVASAFAERAGSNPLKDGKDYEKAVSDFETAIDIASRKENRLQYSTGLDRIREQYANWLKQQGRLSEAASWLDKVARSSGTETPTHEKKRIEDEIKELRSEAKRLFAQAESLLGAKEWEKAADTFRKVAQLDRSLKRRADYGVKQALAGQANEKIQAAIAQRDWDEARKWLDQLSENGDRDEADRIAEFIDAGVESDKLLAQAKEWAGRAQLSAAQDFLRKARQAEAANLPAIDSLDKEIGEKKAGALEAADAAKNLAMHAAFDKARSEIEIGQKIWADWKGWPNVTQFIADERKRTSLTTRADAAFEQQKYLEASNLYWEAQLVRFDEGTAARYDTAKAWVSSLELTANAEEHIEKKNLAQAVKDASKAVKLQPENKSAARALSKAHSLSDSAQLVFGSATEAKHRGDWREAVRLLEQCVSEDRSHRAAAKALEEAKSKLMEEWGIRYSATAAPAHVYLRHWVAWLVIAGLMAALVALRKNAYLTFFSGGGGQLVMRRYLLSQKWWGIARIAASAVFGLFLLVLVILWISYEGGADSLIAGTEAPEASQDILRARKAHQSLIEQKPLSHHLPSSRLAIMNLSNRLPENERIPIQVRQTGIQEFFESSRRAVGPYSIDYLPVLISILSLGIIAFLLIFRLKKRLVPRFLLCVAMFPPVIVLIIEVLSTQSTGTGEIALPLSAFSRFIPYIAADASLLVAAVLCFLGTADPRAAMEALKKFREEKAVARKLKESKKEAKKAGERKPLVISRKEKEKELREEMPWLPEHREQRKPVEEKIPLPSSHKPERPQPQESLEEHEFPREPPRRKLDIGDVDEFIKQLHDEDAEKRVEAARTLGDMEDAKALDPLIEALGDPEIAVREAAALALEHVGRYDLDLLKISHHNEKDEQKRERLGEIIAALTGHEE